MTSRTILILVGTSLALVAGGAMVLRAGSGAGSVAPTQRGPLLPALVASPDTASRIVVTRGALRVEVERAQAGQNRWVVASHHGYPADERVVRDVLTGAIDAVVLEEKTAIAANFGRLGVADPGSAESGADAAAITSRLTIEGPAGTDQSRPILADVLVGRPDVATPATRPAPGQPPRVFVRRWGEGRALLAQGNLGADPNWLGWVSTMIARIDAEQIDRVEITPPGGMALVLERSKETGAIGVVGVPEGRALREELAAARLASVVSTLNFDDVVPVASKPIPDDSATVALFTRRDGLVVTIRTIRTAPSDGEFWIRIEASAGEGTAGDAFRAEAEEMNRRWSPWAFRVAKFRGEDLTRTLEDLLAPPAPPDPATEAPPAP